MGVWLSRRGLGFAPCGHKLGQADDGVGGHGEDENDADLGDAAHLHLSEPADRLRPAEGFLDALAQPLPPGLKPGGTLAATSLGTAVLRVLPSLLTVPSIATCGSIPRAFKPSTKASASYPLSAAEGCPFWASAG